MNRKAVRNSRSEKNEDFFQRKQLFNTKLLPQKECSMSMKRKIRRRLSNPALPGVFALIELLVVIAIISIMD